MTIRDIRLHWPDRCGLVLDASIDNRIYIEPWTPTEQSSSKTAEAKRFDYPRAAASQTTNLKSLSCERDFA